MERRVVFMIVVSTLLAFASGRAVSAPRGALDVEGEIAKQHFLLGEFLYKHDRYVEAVAEFEAARKIDPRPDFDYNIARCYERIQEWNRAIEAYERYVAWTPTPLDAESILDHLNELRVVRERANVPGAAPLPGMLPRLPASRPMQTDAAAPVAPFLVMPPAPPATAGKKERLIALVLGATGVVSLAAGIAFGVTGNSTSDALSRSTGVYDPGAEGNLRTQRGLEYAFLAIGSAALAAGVTTLVIGILKARHAATAPHVAAAPGGLQVRF